VPAEVRAVTGAARALPAIRCALLPSCQPLSAPLLAHSLLIPRRLLAPQGGGAAGGRVRRHL
jgi:hypothetical protein